MGASVDYLQAHWKSGRLSYRRAFPPELRRFIAGSPVELKRSLGAKSIADPVAHSRFAAAATEYERIVGRARKMAAGALDVLTPELEEYLARSYEAERLAEDEEVRWLDRPRDVKRRAAANLREACEEDLADCMALRGTGDVSAIVDAWGAAAADFAEGRGYIVDQTTEAFSRLCRAFNDANIKVWQAIIARLDGHDIPTPVEPLPPAPKGPSVSGQSFRAVVEAILKSPVHRISETTKETTRTALRYLVEAHGDLPPARLTRKAVTEWLDLLALKPAKLSWADRGLKLRDAVAKFEGQDAPRLSPKTLEQYVTALGARWKQAVSDGLIAEGMANPFRDRPIRQAPKPEVKQHFNRNELQAIFDLPIFTDGERPAGGKGDASYWLPLLLLWTGARPEEIAQLMVSDVYQDSESGRWFMRITDEGVHPHKGQRRLKTSDAASGRRTFPVPAPVMALNFLAYVEHLRRADETALFPRLRTKGQRGMLHSAWAEWWRLYVRDLGVLPKGEPRKPAREFRDAWATAARASRLPREAMEYIMGHKPPSATSNEDYGRKLALGDYVNEVTFNGLDLSRVRPWSATE